MDVLYVKAKSKREINERIARGIVVTATRYKLGDADRVTLNTYPHRIALKLYHATINGTPIARSYAVWNPLKGRVQ